MNAMSKDLKQIIRDAASLPEADRATLAGVLIESLEGDPDEGVETAWTAEVNRRAAEIDSGEVALVPWEDVRKQLFAK